ncbi:MAG: DUF5348 domain-containing protein [Clostridiales bacterium]|nr:DUF5348 domain-containing protein [Clostridiales bacterium]
MQGKLSYNQEIQRYGIRDGYEWLKPGLHCGDVLRVLISGEWMQCRIEMAGDAWYLDGTDLKGTDLEGLPAEMRG